MTPLADNYSPGPFDVICARGKEARTHEGNRHFAEIVSQAIAQYSQASTRFEKSVLVSEIVRVIRNKSPNGGFVRRENGKWHEVGDHLAREKVGQGLRDLLHTQYKSSTKAKKRRRQEENAKLCDDMLETVIQTNEYMPKRMKQLSQSIQQQGSHASDMYLMLVMTQANCDILEAIKKDADLQRVINDNAAVAATSTTTTVSSTIPPLPTFLRRAPSTTASMPMVTTTTTISSSSGSIASSSASGFNINMKDC